ncbi:MAG TPA: hypothetical protein VHU80_22310 [Polyangiaceae bacterium]|jgi:hypothetical protein|nr:hypothetical protein [Polyangiaceae bacterium]
MTTRRTALLTFSVLLAGAGVAACKDSGKVSAARAGEHVAFLVDTVSKDVAEVRRGLPLGAEALAARIKNDPDLPKDLDNVRDSLELARRKVQDLRVAKSTFFALADLSGTALRNDQEQDRMAGRSFFASFPALAAAKDKYVETTGSMPEAAGVRAPRADGQWVAATPVKVDGTTDAIYVSGWSWASYAYRLEFAIRGKLRSELADKKDEKEPLVYAFVVDGKNVFGAPVTPEVDATTIAGLDPLGRIKEGETFTTVVDVTGRSYGLAARRAPALGANIGVAVLRSET